MYWKNTQGRNPSNFLGHFLEISDFWHFCHSDLIWPLKNAGLQTTACLRNHQMLDKDLNNSNLNLLLRFQRLLFIQLFEEIKSFSSDNGISVEEGDLQGKLSLLKKYLSLLSHHVSDVMPLAISYGNEGPVQYVHACGILQKDVIGHLLPGTLTAINLKIFHKVKSD